MTPREDFLRRVFGLLDERCIAYCVQRNFDAVFAEGPSDIDLLACDVPAVREICEQAARESGFVLVQAARFVNHSWIFAGASGVLVRIDVDTAVRWRCFHVLSAAEVLASRQRGEHFYVPSPEHEAAILRAQIAWRGEGPERYLRRLKELGAPAVSASQARWSIAMGSLIHPGAALGYIASDAARYLSRCFDAFRREPARTPGVSIVLAGLDGVGKTTFARALLAEIARSRRFAGARYFHWIPSPFRRPEFPWPAAGTTPRRAPQPRSLLASALSAARLVRNLVLAWLAFALVVRPLVRRGCLVVIDRYVTNYWLDPASVRYAGPQWLLAWVEDLFPKADASIVFSADAKTLHSRKGELSDEQIAEQSERLLRLPLLADERFDLDATQSVEKLVARVLERLTKR